MTIDANLSHEPVFAQVPRLKPTRVTTAITNPLQANPTNPVLIGTLGAQGGLFNKLRVMPVATISATMMYLYYRVPGIDAAGVMHLYATKSIAAQTIANPPTTEITPTDWTIVTDSLPDRLPGSTEIYFGQTAANQVEVFPFTADN